MTLLFSLFFVNGSIAEPLGAGLMQRFGASSRGTSGGTQAAPRGFDLPVTVSNTDNNPVPVTVQGTSNQPLTATIDGTVDTNATITGTVNTDATINGTVDTRDVNEPTTHAVQYSTVFSYQTDPLVYHSLVTVPSGKRLIIRYVSGVIYESVANQATDLIIETQTDATTISHHIPMVSEKIVTIQAATVARQYFGLETWIAADADTDVSAVVNELSDGLAANGWKGSVAISGYLVDMPAPPTQ